MNRLQNKHQQSTSITKGLTCYGVSPDEGEFQVIRKNASTTSSYLDSKESGTLAGNIENFIGYAHVPVGLAGPLLIKGEHAQGHFDIPLATTEGALVASYSRGMKACRLAGGIKALCKDDMMIRAPYFKFADLSVAASFCGWLENQFLTLAKVSEKTSSYCKLKQVKLQQEGNAVIVYFSFLTGDAAGQNMTTIATDAICNYVMNNAPARPLQWYIESNASGDKKATRKGLIQTRGKKVIAEITLPRMVVKSVLKSTPESICEYFSASTLASISTGCLGNIGHIANGLTALFIACGQDVACIAESVAGILRMECTSTGELYAALTLPSLVVGTVGGGTGLATQSKYLRMMNCYGAGNAKKFAELCVATALAGELSIAAAIAEDHFTTAHKNLGRLK